MDIQTKFTVPLLTLIEEQLHLEEMDKMRYDFLQKRYPLDWFDICLKDEVRTGIIRRIAMLELYAEKVLNINDFKQQVANYKNDKEAYLHPNRTPASKNG